MVTATLALAVTASLGAFASADPGPASGRSLSPTIASTPVAMALQSQPGPGTAAPTPTHTARSAARTAVAPALAPPPAPTTVSGLPVPAWRAYHNAAERLGPCGLQWYVLAGIGMAESDHGRVGGAEIGRSGLALPNITGPVLDGHGSVAAIADTDGGQLDGDLRWDRAVGPMQFIPATWRAVAVDGDGNGVANPNDIDDAALAAGNYLCQAGDLRDDSVLAAAIRSYNNSREYVILVTAYANDYRRGDYPTVPAQLLGHLHSGPGAPQTPRHQQHETAAKPDPKPKPVHVTVVLTGVPTQCDAGWCVDDTYAGDLRHWPVTADYDGDCEEESMPAELRGLAAAELEVEVTVVQTGVDSEVTETVVKKLAVVDPPEACDPPVKETSGRRGVSAPGPGAAAVVGPAPRPVSRA